MNYLSICSGIEAATVAWHPLGWTPVAFAEKDPFPSAVLAHHYPHIANLGDITRFQSWENYNFDLLVGGTPCQSFSIAGLRAGLRDPRGNLMLTYVAIAARYRPRWLLWENVPGVLSSHGGRDFGTFLGALAELGYGFAYRVLDAQYVRVDGFGRAVPQRRRRVFVVGYLGDWRRATAVLFDPESLRGNSSPRREAGQATGPTLSARTQGGGGLGTDFDCDGGLVTSHDPACTLTAREFKGPLPEADLSTVVAHALRADGFDASEDGTGRGTPIIPVAETLTAPSARSNGAKAGNQVGLLNPIIEPVAFSCKDYGADAGVIAPTLRSMGHDASHANAGGQLAVAFDMRGRQDGSQMEGPHDTANIRAAAGGSSRSYIAQSWRVRRLTPTECERLQGFRDGYTAVPYRGKLAADGPRYKALGNSMAANAMRWIGTRIAWIDAYKPKSA